MGRLSDEYQWSSKLWEVQCLAAGVTELANPRQLAGGGGGEGLFPLRCVTALAARTADVWPASVLQCLSALTPPPVITLTGDPALWHLPLCQLSPSLTTPEIRYKLSLYLL